MSIPLLFSKRAFHPRQLFSALQGAWLEPTPGFIWQENTGVNPTTTGGQTIGRIDDQSGGGNNATQATAGNRPTYQLDSNGLPLARHDATDSLVVSLPSINVRRNLLARSEQFDNAAWTKQQSFVLPNASVAPDFTITADLLSEQANTATHNTFQPTTIAGSAVTSFSVYAKEFTRRYLIVGHAVTASDWIVAVFDLRTGTVTQQSTGSTGTILSATATAVANGYIRCALVGSVSGANRSASIQLSDVATYTPANFGARSYTGDGTSGIYIWGAQLDLGSVATNYQRITDWTSEAYSSNGSVYFSTPVGMSVLHNQSMGTSYTLPALSTDIYSWIVEPQRLNSVLEGRLERYMLRKANLPEPDYLLDSNDNQLTVDDDTALLLRA